MPQEPHRKGNTHRWKVDFPACVHIFSVSTTTRRRDKRQKLTTNPAWLFLFPSMQQIQSPWNDSALLVSYPATHAVFKAASTLKASTFDPPDLCPEDDTSSVDSTHDLEREDWPSRTKAASSYFTRNDWTWCQHLQNNVVGGFSPTVQLEFHSSVVNKNISAWTLITLEQLHPCCVHSHKQLP